MYGKCGSIKEAEIVFCELPVRNVVTWNALLSAYIEQNDGERALRLYRQMHQEGMYPYERTYVIALQACSIFAEMEEASSVEKQKVISLEIGRAVHVDAVKNGATASDVFMGSALLSMYGKSGSFTEAENVLSELPKHYTVFWNVLLSAYVKHKQGKKALHLYTKMLHEGTSPDELIFVAVLQACVIFAENENSSFVDGRPLKVFCSEVVKALHQDAQRKGFCSDIFLASTLINAHGSCGDIIDAETVFQGLFKRDIVTWNSMLSAYIDQGQGEKALQLYRQMQEECTVKEERTSVIALQACCILAEQDSYINLIPGQSIKAMSLWLGEAVHADARRKGFDLEIFICNTLVSMYSKCGDIVKAENVFYGMSKRDKVSWCAMLTAYLEHDEAEKALWLFRQMQVDGMILDKLHYVVAFQACGSLAEEEEAVFVEEHAIKLCSLRISQAIHAYAEVQNFISDVIVGSTLVSVYGKCGAIKEAHSVFNELFRRDMVACNAMLSAFLEQGLNHDALSLFIQIQKEGVTLDSVTFLCILHACSETENEEISRQLHFIIAASVYDTGLLLTNSLIHAYGSCASVGNAKVVFDGLHQGDVVSWTACISGNARIGDFAASLQIFEAMVSTCISPDEVTFLSLLSACSRAGLVHEGVQYFESITGNYGIAPNLKHFSGMIDLLGRAGNLKKMENLLIRMPVKADLTTWVTLLAVCRTHGNSELGKYAFECAVHVQPMEAMSYILMSNIYAEAGPQDCCE